VESDDSLLDWLLLMKAERMEEYEMLAAKNPLIKQTVDILKRLSSDRKTRLIYDAREKARMDERARMRGEYNKGKTEGKIEGKLEGKMEGKIEVAKNMLHKGSDIEIIAEVTGLSLKEIKSIKDPPNS
jgi:predicted transposase/invertase (TIGR01784 family)